MDFFLVDVKNIMVKTEIEETDISKVKNNTRCDITLSTLKNKVFKKIK